MIQISNYAISLSLILPFVIAFGLFRAVFGYYNFALGVLHTAGLYLSYLLRSSTAPILLAGGAFFIILATISALQIGLLEPLRRRGARADTLLIISLGLYIAFEQVLSLTFGDAIAFGDFGAIFPNRLYAPGFAFPQLIILVSAILVFVGYKIITQASEVGERIQAVAEAPELCRIVGLNVRALEWIAFYLSVVLVMLGAFFSSLETGAFPTAGFNIVVIAFAVSLLGGSPFEWRFFVVLGAIVAIKQIAATVLTSQWAPTVTYAVLLGGLYASRKWQMRG